MCYFLTYGLSTLFYNLNSILLKVKYTVLYFILLNAATAQVCKLPFPDALVGGHLVRYWQWRFKRESCRQEEGISRILCFQFFPVSLQQERTGEGPASSIQLPSSGPSERLKASCTRPPRSYVLVTPPLLFYFFQIKAYKNWRLTVYRNRSDIGNRVNSEIYKSRVWDKSLMVSSEPGRSGWKRWRIMDNGGD